MASTGCLLRKLREGRGVSLEDLARITRIGREFLEALEADDLGKLPPGPFAKGFIRAYCQALGEPPDEALALHSARAGALTRIPEGALKASRSSLPRNRAPVLMSFALLVVLALALASVTLALRPRQEMAAPRTGDDVRLSSALVAGAAEARAASVVAAMSPVAEAPPVPADPNPLPPPPTAISKAPPASAKGPATGPRPATTARSYRLVARASQPTWIRVRIDGSRTIEETIPAGARREWVSKRPFELRIANAGGLTLELNGRVLPPLGPRGATVHRLVLPAEPR
jgi:cytoskeletal protein RodZ